MARGSADDVLEGIPESAGLLGVQLDNQATTALERDAHHDAASFLGDLQRTVARPRLHRRHPRTFLLSCARGVPRDPLRRTRGPLSLIGGSPLTRGDQPTAARAGRILPCRPAPHCSTCTATTCAPAAARRRWR